MHVVERLTQLSGALLGAGLWMLGSCGDEALYPTAPDFPTRLHATAVRALPSGTRIAVKLTCNLSSGTAHVGDPWRGVVVADVLTREGSVIPAGSPVEGVVAGVTPARPGSRGMLALSAQSIRLDGREHPMVANASPVVFDLGASPGSGDPETAAGPLRVGGPVGRDRGPLVDSPDGVTFATAGPQPDTGRVLQLPEGAVMGFTLSRPMTVR